MRCQMRKSTCLRHACHTVSRQAVRQASIPVYQYTSRNKPKHRKSDAWPAWRDACLTAPAGRQSGRAWCVTRKRDALSQDKNRCRGARMCDSWWLWTQLSGYWRLFTQPDVSWLFRVNDMFISFRCSKFLLHFYLRISWKDRQRMRRCRCRKVCENYQGLLCFGDNECNCMNADIIAAMDKRKIVVCIYVFVDPPAQTPLFVCIYSDLPGQHFFV